MRKNKMSFGWLVVLLFFPTLLFANTPSLLGTWSSACATDGGGNYNIETFNFSRDTAVYSIKTYSDSKCKHLISTLSAYRNYKLGSRVSNLKDTRKLDYVFKKVTMTYNNPKMITTANSKAFYGLTNWKLNQPKVVTHLKRNNLASREHAKGDKFFTIVKIKKDRLYMGDYASGSGTSDNSRLSKIYSVPFVKQNK